jgi:crotonobetainyl-CoA:carnitine CoA-transferase CaiB-like acyl-CoA transferase
MNDGLFNLHVIELGGGIAAPMVGKLLADLGATVVKVEPPGGDPARRRGPFPDNQVDPEASGTFLYLNSNKRSVVLDLHQAAGRHRLEALVKGADLLIHNYPPQEMASQGIDYEHYRRVNPRLVMLSITPFGLTGPHRDYAACDLTLYHAGGLGWLCPGKGTPLTLPPIKPFGEHAYTQAALHGAVAAMAACYGAAQSGTGEHLDLSVQEVGTFFLGRTFATYTYGGVAQSRNSPTPYEPQSLYPCKDGYIYLICAEQNQWERLVEVMGNPPWAHEERFATRDQRGANGDELKACITAWTSQHGVAELFHACQQARVGAAPVLTAAQLEHDAHLSARQFFARQSHPQAGTVTVPGPPYRLQKPWWTLRTPAPLAGEANGELTTLFADRQVATTPPSGPRNTAGQTPPLPLAGVRVLDLSWVWAGPHCTMMLAFLGAEVIKVESSARLDITRRTNPFPPELARGVNHSGYFGCLNQAKKSIGINLSQPAGRELVKRLAAQCDVMISNFGTGVLERLGLGSEEMQRVNPDLIIAMISAFGQTGPLRHYMGYGPLISPLAGLAAVTGYDDGEPQDVGMPYGDPNGGVYTAFAIAAALWARGRHGGGGQVIDLAMWEAMLCTSFEAWMNHALGNLPYTPMGNHDPVWAPHNVYRCQGDDDWVAIAATNEREWQALCHTIEQPELAEDPRFREAPARKANEAALDQVIGAWCATRERWTITRTLATAGVPAFPSMSMRDLLQDPHLIARACFTHWQHPEVGPRPLMGAPWRFTNRPNDVGSHAPLLGEHSDAVLEALLGLGAEQRARLRAAGVVE